MRDLQQRRDVTSVRVGSLVRFRQKDLDKYIEANVIAAVTVTGGRFNACMTRSTDPQHWDRLSDDEKQALSARIMAEECEAAGVPFIASDEQHGKSLRSWRVHGNVEEIPNRRILEADAWRRMARPVRPDASISPEAG